MARDAGQGKECKPGHSQTNFYAFIALILVARNGHIDMPSTLRATEHKRMPIKQANRFRRSVTPKQKSFTKIRRRMARFLHQRISTRVILMRQMPVTQRLHPTKTLQSQSKLPLRSERRRQRTRRKRSHHQRNRPRQRQSSQ